uniref:Thioredoxin-like_fold domain-containing protein n=1 Tax=Steinernema glaseri TaxID=37863 RepID=A0A1I8AWS5_9BILA
MLCECVPSLGQVAFVLVSFFAGKFAIGKLLERYNARTETDVHKKDWKKDVVYLYQFPRAPVTPNLSPFCLKLETWLRANKITYEVVPTYTLRSTKGLLPFVEINGKEIADSQHIIFELEKQFEVKSELNAEQAGISRTVDRLIDGNTFYALIYSKVYENAPKFLSKESSGMPIPSFLIPVIGYLFSQKIFGRLKSHGMGKFPPSVVYDQLRRDLRAVDGILGDKDFICGDKPSLADFTFFGHIGSCYFLPYNQPVTDMLNHEFPRLLALLKRIRTEFWSDWDNLCSS